MNSYNINYSRKTEEIYIQVIHLGLISNPIQTSNIINNSRQIIPQYNSFKTTEMNPIQSGYNSVNILSSQSKPNYQELKSNIIKLKC